MFNHIETFQKQLHTSENKLKLTYDKLGTELLLFLFKYKLECIITVLSLTDVVTSRSINENETYFRYLPKGCGSVGTEENSWRRAI